MSDRLSGSHYGAPRSSSREVIPRRDQRGAARALALASAAVLVLGTTLAGPVLAAGRVGAASLVSAAKQPPPSGPPLSVEPFQVYRPESTGGYIAEEYGQTSIWWRFTTLRDGAGKFTFTFPAAPAGARGFGALQRWDPPVTPVDAGDVVALASQNSLCRPTITALVSGEGIDQSVEAKYPSTCRAGMTFILMWRGPLYWNGFADTNGPDAQPNPHDDLSFPVKMQVRSQKTFTTTDIKVVNFPAAPIGLEPVEFVDPVTEHTDATVPMMLIDMVSTPVYLNPTTPVYEPTFLEGAGRDVSGTPIETSISIIGTSVIDVTGNLVLLDPYLADPMAALDRTIITPIVVDGGCTYLNVGCTPGADGYVTLPASAFIDQSGDPVPADSTVALSFTLMVFERSNQLGANLLCNAYAGTFDVPPGYAGLWTCTHLPTRAKVDAFVAELLQYRPEMGTYYCPSRKVGIDYLPGTVSCAAS